MASSETIQEPQIGAQQIAERFAQEFCHWSAGDYELRPGPDPNNNFFNVHNKNGDFTGWIIEVSKQEPLMLALHQMQLVDNVWKSFGQPRVFKYDDCFPNVREGLDPLMVKDLLHSMEVANILSEGEISSRRLMTRVALVCALIAFGIGIASNGPSKKVADFKPEMPHANVAAYSAATMDMMAKGGIPVSIKPLLKQKGKLSKGNSSVAASSPSGKKKIKKPVAQNLVSLDGETGRPDAKRKVKNGGRGDNEDSLPHGGGAKFNGIGWCYCNMFPPNPPTNCSDYEKEEPVRAANLKEFCTQNSERCGFTLENFRNGELFQRRCDNEVYRILGISLQ
ncbi:MAG: hypothetical protein AAB588_00660 [Patescibacteria group bacterium]